MTWTMIFSTGGNGGNGGAAAAIAATSVASGPAEADAAAFGGGVERWVRRVVQREWRGWGRWHRQRVATSRGSGSAGIRRPARWGPTVVPATFLSPAPGGGASMPASATSRSGRAESFATATPGRWGARNNVCVLWKHGRGTRFRRRIQPRSMAAWRRPSRPQPAARPAVEACSPQRSGRRERDLDCDYRSRRAGSSAVDRNRIRHKPKRRGSVRRSVHSKDQLCWLSVSADSGGVIAPLQRRHSDDQCDRARRVRSGPRQPRPDRLRLLDRPSRQGLRHDGDRRR